MADAMASARAKGVAALFGAALLWGVAFAAQSSAADVVGSFTFIAGKSSVACVFLLCLIGVRHLRKRSLAHRIDPAAANGANDARGIVVETAEAAARRRKIAAIGGVICGLALFAADNCQQWGITAYPPEAAASGRAGFLTATYVVMVAVASIFSGKRLHPVVVASAVICLGGMYLLCVPENVGGIYIGDVVMLGGAVFYTVHIFTIARFAATDALWMSCIQFLTSAALSAVCAVVVEGATPASFLPALLPILYVGVFSTGLGYTLQAIGQKNVDAAPAAVIMSLESVFAALAGWVLLGERLSGIELAGCTLVFAAVILAQWPELRRSRAQGEGGGANAS